MSLLKLNDEQAYRDRINSAGGYNLLGIFAVVCMFGRRVSCAYQCCWLAGSKSAGSVAKSQPIEREESKQPLLCSDGRVEFKLEFNQLNGGFRHPINQSRAKVAKV